MKCDHNSCNFDGNNKPIPVDKQPNAVWRITGYIYGRELTRCQKHFEAFDLLHQAVLLRERAGVPAVAKSTWKPEQVAYEAIRYVGQ